MTLHHLNYERVAEAIGFLSRNFREQPSLQDVAEHVHLSPEHFQRIFTEWAGVSPKKFTQFLTIDYLRNHLHEFSSVQDAADASGLSAQSRVYDLFVNIEGVTPDEFRQRGKGLEIRYGFHNSPFGECFIAATERGICGLSFVSDTTPQVEFGRFEQKWKFAELKENQAFTKEIVENVFQPERRKSSKITLLVQGTNFQLKVWEALLSIPAGSVATYEHIARSIGRPGAARAVGMAIGNNPVGYIIPCHRVIKKAGQIGEYHWGVTRKRALIGWEMAQAATG
ncbi:MAG: methylated-DNA--[protein]-cysteine S-methyltransferase [Lewinellaceae bacterium]|nr:methylated-DNA--[protein]-cysteine S-methyltransferase [Lewinellaceae bacterium]